MTQTNYWCQPGRCNSVELPMLQCTGWDQAFDAIRRDAGGDEVRDIRAWFASSPSAT
jgi:hypothetical protein